MVNPVTYQADKKVVCDFILTKLSSLLINDKYSELKYLLDELQNTLSTSALNLAFSKVVRVFGKENISYSDTEINQANAIRKSWQPPSSIDKAIRILLILELPDENETAFLSGYQSLFSTADLGESAALYATLPLLPYPEKLIARCEEGVRTNMGEVFESVANNNPFPADYLSEDAFNQMVLKCVFVGKPLFRITHLQQRLNEDLARMAIDYAHERWAAARELTPEIWQLIQPFLNATNIADAQRLAASQNQFEKQAAALVCYDNKMPEVQNILQQLNLNSDIENGSLSWQTLGKQVWQNQ